MSNLKRTDLIGTIDDRIKFKERPTFEEGVIISVFGNIAKVRTKGTSQIRNVEKDNTNTDDVGKNCLIYWSQKSGKYMLIALGASNTASPPVTVNTGSGQTGGLQLFPPDNFSVLTTEIPDIIVAKWNSPVQRPVAIEVQTNTIASDSGATTDIIQRGAYALIQSSVNLYVRARAIGENFTYSSWTDWILGTPGVIPTPTLALDDLTDVIITSPAENDLLLYIDGYWRNVPEGDDYFWDGTSFLTDGTDYLY